MKLRRNKKGFTIVELVIVIAVIGVLAAVLIPVFVNLTNKANKASDESLVKNLNTALATQEQEIGDTKNNTLHDAVLDLEDYGYKLPNLVTKSDEKLLWNQKTNRFILEDGDHQGYDDIDFWRIQNSITGDEVYSVYAGIGFKGNGLTEDVVDVKVGFDAGYHDEIAKVNYVRVPNGESDKQEAIVRTNSFETILNITAPKDTIKHYGPAGLVDIVSIDKNSYHEHGDVLLAKIASGRIVVTEEANIGGIHAVATNDQFNDIAVGVVGNAEVPTITRDRVSIDDEDQEGVYSQFVLEVQNLSDENTQSGDSEYVWISVTVDGSGNSTVTTQVATSSTELTAETIIPASEQSTAAQAIAEDASATLKFYDANNEVDFKKALASIDDNIVINITDGFEMNTVAQFTRPTTIYGFGHEIKGKGNRVLRVSAPDLDIEIYDLAITSTCTATSDVRGISFDDSSDGTSLMLDRCSVSASFYAINASAGADNLDITIRNGTVAAGWASFNMYCNNSTITVENSTLRGLNDKGESNWNNFNTITFDGNCLWKSKSNVGTAGSNNRINITKSTIYADSKSGNKQYWIGLQYGAINNRVVVDSETKIINSYEEDMTGVLNIGFYCNYDSTNKVFKDHYENNSTIKVGDETIRLVTEFDDDGNYVRAYYVVE